MRQAGRARYGLDPLVSLLRGLEHKGMKRMRPADDLSGAHIQPTLSYHDDNQYKEKRTFKNEGRAFYMA
jgi:hypothetical protein